MLWWKTHLEVNLQNTLVSHLLSKPRLQFHGQLTPFIRIKWDSFFIFWHISYQGDSWYEEGSRPGGKETQLPVLALLPSTEQLPFLGLSFLWRKCQANHLYYPFKLWLLDSMTHWIFSSKDNLPSALIVSKLTNHCLSSETHKHSPGIGSSDFTFKSSVLVGLML